MHLDSLGPNIFTGKVSSTLGILYYHKSDNLFTKYQPDGKIKHNLHEMMLFDILPHIKCIPNVQVEWKMEKVPKQYAQGKGYDIYNRL